MKKYVSAMPQDYLIYASKKQYDKALEAIWKHISKVKKYK